VPLSLSSPDVAEDRHALRLGDGTQTLRLRYAVDHLEHASPDRLLEHERGVGSVVGRRAKEARPYGPADRDSEEVGLPRTLTLAYQGAEQPGGPEEPGFRLDRGCPC